MKQISYFILLCLLVLAGASANASALEHSTLERSTREAQETCPKLNCLDLHVWVVNMRPREFEAMGTQHRADLKKIVTNFARREWPDRFLADRFYQAGRFKMENVQKLFWNDEHVGYRLSFSDKAWDMRGCEENQDLDKCRSGRIFESVFVDLEMKDIFVDEHASAQFVPDDEVSSVSESPGTDEANSL